ncbi:RadC family protein [Roseococcus sp. YIM B11640]|uniref:RadC family protein n=1 Tax=Roseococcus sp. YIM B11640 TaxID=3133973 RepID=UPI003C7EC65B
MRPKGLSEASALFPVETGGRSAPAAPVGAEGHRGRMRQKLLEAGPDGVTLTDRDLIEMVLFLALPRRDTRSIALALLNRFGSFAEALSAPAQELRQVEGMGDAAIAALRTVQVAAIRLAAAPVRNQEVLNSWAKLMDYLNTLLARERVEHFRVLFLDSKNRLIADEQQGKGTVNHTPAYPREIVKRALELHATAVILVHNHPSGDPQPSRGDIEMTAEVRAAAQALGITLHDHLIIGRGEPYSFRREGLI